MKHSDAAHAIWNRDGSLTIRTPYVANLIEDWKFDIQSAFRTYDPKTRTWTFHGESAPMAALDLLRRYVARVEVEDNRPGQHRATTSAATPWAAALFQALPDRLHRPAYRALARVVHPDVGGDNELAQQLNDAFRARQAPPW